MGKIRIKVQYLISQKYKKWGKIRIKTEKSNSKMPKNLQKFENKKNDEKKYKNQIKNA